MSGARLLAVLLLSLLPVTLAQTVSTLVAMDQELRPGERGNAAFTFRLDDPDMTVTEGVWFLNIVQPLENGDARQVSHLLFDEASEEGDGFRRVFSHEELSGGVTMTVAFRISRNATPGSYLVALQLFRGTVTNPSRVKVDDRVWLELHPLTVLVDSE